MPYLIFIILLLPCHLAAETYQTYYNSRYDYVIQYPSSLYPQGEAPNGDGQIFLSKNADAQLSVYAHYNALEQSLEEAYLEQSRGGQPDDPNKVVTYRRMKNNWFVVSGYREGKVFYQKTLLNNDTFKTFLFIYDENKKSLYEPMIKHLVSSFKG